MAFAAVLIAALLQAAPLPPSATPAPPTSDLSARSRTANESAFAAIQSGHPQQAYDLLAPIVAEHEVANAREKRLIFCGMTLPESLLYMTMAAGKKRDGVAIAPDYCTALYLQGYALVDLGRVADARATYRRVIALAPMHAHFIAELGLSYRFDKNWAAMRDTCVEAENAAALSDEETKNRELGIALRCQGFALIELGQLDEAEKRFVRCLQIDPNDRKAKSELTYIQRQRLDAKKS